MNALPFFDRTGDAEHARPAVPYWRGMSLDEIERHAHTCGDTATLALIDLIMDAAGTRRSEAIERAVAMRQSVREAADAEARIAELHERIRVQDHYLAQSRDLADAVRYVLPPFAGKPGPKWAQHLSQTLARLTKARHA
jgi:hypothetical protein